MSKRTLLCVFLVLFFLFFPIADSQSSSVIAEVADIQSEDIVPIDEYIHVCMEHAYSFPDTDYTPEYFNAEYVKAVETVAAYTEGSLCDKNSFNRIEKLYLTDEGKSNIDRFIKELTDREDILIAERDYNCRNVSALDNPNDPSNINQKSTDYIENL